MAFTPTGHNANAYLSLDDADGYWLDRGGETWTAATEAARQAAIMEATQFIDAKFADRFAGSIKSTSQSLEWPRIGAKDRSGRVLQGIPKPVQSACAELAHAALTERLMPVEERGGEVKRTVEQIGSIREETEYADHAPSGRSYGFAEMLLKPVLAHGRGLKRV